MISFHYTDILGIHSVHIYLNGKKNGKYIIYFKGDIKDGKLVKPYKVSEKGEYLDDNLHGLKT